MTRPLDRQARWNRAARGGAIALITALLAATSGAGAPEPPRFRVERIAVEGLRHGKPGIVVAAALLHPGEAYTEAELRAAVYRVERLPFVLAADFSLRKGTVRDTFELVITVTETSTFFLGLNLTLDLPSYGAFGRNKRLTAQPTVGGRVFAGGYSEISAAVTSSTASSSGPLRQVPYQAQVAYTNYNLLGRSLVGTVTVGRIRSEWADLADTNQLEARLVVPLGGDNALRFDLFGSRSDGYGCKGYVVGACGPNPRGARISVEWLLDTTDDPFTPRSGTRLSAGGWRSEDQVSGLTDRAWSPHADVMHFFPVGRHQAVGVGGSYAYLWADEFGYSAYANRQSQAALNLSHTLQLWRPQARETFTQSWLQSSVAVSQTVQRLDPFFHWELDTIAASAALTGRVRWGTVQFILTYSRNLRSRSW